MVHKQTRYNQRPRSGGYRGSVDMSASSHVKTVIETYRKNIVNMSQQTNNSSVDQKQIVDNS